MYTTLNRTSIVVVVISFVFALKCCYSRAFSEHAFFYILCVRYYPRSLGIICDNSDTLKLTTSSRCTGPMINFFTAVSILLIHRPFSGRKECRRAVHEIMHLPEKKNASVRVGLCRSACPSHYSGLAVNACTFVLVWTVSKLISDQPFFSVLSLAPSPESQVRTVSL